MLYFIVVYATLLINDADSAERVNCRRVVFHPYCRGISAKRSSLQTEE